MTLREKQSLFVRLFAELIERIYQAGYELTLGEAFRTPEQAALDAAKGTGIVHSLHTQRLAIDLNLFKDGVWLETSDAHRPFGEWWEAQSTPDYQCKWGGRFPKPDGNHYSIAHDGYA
jgi:hypothetical protein